MRKVKKVPLYLVMIIISLVSLFPFYFMFIMSTYQSEQVMRTGFTFIPGTYMLENIKTIFKGNYLTSYLNSILVSVLATVLSVLICTAAGYGISLYQFRGRKLLRNLVMITLLIPFQIGMVGYLSEMRMLHINNTYLPLILAWLPNSFGVFWIMQYLDSGMQIEVIESARIDGANELHIFFKIAAPLMTPAILTQVMLTFLWSWNNYMLPLVVVNKQKMYTIPLYVMTLAGLYRTDTSAQLTALFLATLPLIILFLFGSKYFQKGLTAGAIKG